MKSNDTASLLADEAPVRSSVHLPNSEGIYETAIRTFVPMPPGGSICHFLIATTQEGYIPGFKFFTRQPRNLIDHMPRVGDKAFPTDREAFGYCLDAAKKFFIDHSAVLEALRKWSETVGFKIAAQDVTVSLPSPSSVGSATGTVVAPGNSDLTIDAGLAQATIPPRPHYADIALDEIEPDPANRRSNRTEADIAALAESIKAGGLLQAIALRDMCAGREGKPDAKRYRIIFGEGRWLAHKRLGRASIEAKVYSGIDAGQVRAFALVENLQRLELNPVDEAEGFAELSRLGWTPARMAEQTGKTTRTIRRALGLMKLPETVRELVRLGELSARQATALARWVVPPGFEDGASAAGFVPKPRVCEIIARAACKSEHNISSDELADRVPRQVIGTLSKEKLIAEIPADYVGRVPEIETGESFRGESGRLYTFEVEKWKTAKKAIDTEDKIAAEAKEARAKARVTVAKDSKVSVPLTTLQQSKIDHTVLEGDLERYIDHLPEDTVSTGIHPVTKAEVIVCTQPEKLKALIAAERAELAKDREVRLQALHKQATEKIRKLKRLTGREVAIMVDYATFSSGAVVCPSLDGDSFRAQGVRAPKNLTREALASMDPVALARVFLQGTLAAAVAMDHERDLLKWILELPKLGLLEEDNREREKLIKRLAAQLFVAEPFAFDARKTGRLVDFETRADAEGYLDTQRPRRGFVNYTTAIEKDSNGRTYVLKYDLRAEGEPAPAAKKSPAKTAKKSRK